MGRIVSIDYGLKRVGIATTDPLKMIASPLETVDTPKIFLFLKKYLEKEEVERFVVGLPKNLNNEATHSTQAVLSFIDKLEEQFKIPVSKIDERFTSKMAFQTMIDGGLKKKDRQNKSTIDKLSATIILQSYMDSNLSI